MASVSTANDTFPRLLAALPVEPADIQEQARAALGLVLTPFVCGKLKPIAPLPEDPATCPNCGVAVASKRSPYCGDECREIAAFVRQFRSAVEDEKIFEPDRQVALGQKLWRLLGGGLPLRLSLIPERVWAKKLTRGCEVCGEPATTIDNTGCG